MKCTLDKFKTYDIGQVHKDLSTGTYFVQVIKPPTTCPEGVFSTKKAEVVVNNRFNPSLAYSLVGNKPVITVPNDSFVVTYGSSSWTFLDFLLVGGAIVAAILFVRYLLRRSEENTYRDRLAFRPTGYSGGVSYPSAPISGSGGTTVINNGGGSSDLLTGVMLGNMMSGGGGHSHDTTTIIERERVVEHDHGSSHEDSPTDNTYSSDESSSYSSDDSGSSYSSDDSSSSFSSDSGSSGSDFGSSDSGSSFSSD